MLRIAIIDAVARCLGLAIRCDGQPLGVRRSSSRESTCSGQVGSPTDSPGHCFEHSVHTSPKRLHVGVHLGVRWTLAVEIVGDKEVSHLPHPVECRWPLDPSPRFSRLFTRDHEPVGHRRVAISPAPLQRSPGSSFLADSPWPEESAFTRRSRASGTSSGGRASGPAHPSWPPRPRTYRADPRCLLPWPVSSAASCGCG
jgi:hypothetical protein